MPHAEHLIARVTSNRGRVTGPGRRTVRLYDAFLCRQAFMPERFASPTVSVVVPAFNAEKTIARAVHSALLQSFAPHEIVVVNDGSSDRTGHVLSKLLSTSGRIRVLHQENRGVSDARNTGVRAATGDYVAFLDADDEWKPEHLSGFVDHLTANGEIDLYSCGRDGERVTEPKQPERHDRHSYVRRVLRTGWGFNTSGLIARREVIRSHMFRTAFSTGEDMDFVLRLLYDHGVTLHISNIHSFRTHQSGLGGLSNTALDKPNAIIAFCRERIDSPQLVSTDEIAQLERLVARTEISIIKSLIYHRQYSRLKAFSQEMFRGSGNLRVRGWALAGLLLCAQKAPS